MGLSRTFRATVSLASAVAALLAAQASAQDLSAEAAAHSSSPAESPPGIDEVVVRGQRMSEVEADLRIHIGEFIQQVAAPAPGQGYARWNRRVCVGVHNLERSAAQYIADRISSLAAEVGLEPGEPGCTPQVVVMFTVDARATATYMVEHQPRSFRPGMGIGGMQLGREALDEFARSERPVRWWHVSLPVDARTGLSAIPLPQDGGYPVFPVAGPSRIHNGIRDDLYWAIIIVDSTKLAGTTWEQVGDYLAVVALAQIDPKAEPAAFDSILNLFSNPAAYSGLTDWDRSYIRALYQFDQERQPQLQAGEVISEMVRWERDRPQ